MTRAEEIAAALHAWEKIKTRRGARFVLIERGNVLAYFLRESQPEPAAPARCPGCGGNGEIEGGAFTAFPCSKCGGTGKTKPAPAVGEDETLLVQWHDDIVPHASPISSPIVKVGNALAARLRVALADVARLTEERDNALKDGAEANRIARWFTERYNTLKAASERTPERNAGVIAALTEANEELKDALTVSRAALAAAVAKERDACADICDQEATCEGIAQKCAERIRAER